MATMSDPTRTEQVSRPSMAAAFSAILRIFYAPRTVFEQVKAGLPWWPALAVMIVVAVIAALLMLPITQTLIESSMAKAGGQGGTAGNTGVIAIATSLGQAILGMPLLGLLLPAFFFWLALTITFGGAPFGRLFALLVYTGFITLLFQLLNSGYLLATNPEISEPADLAAAGLNFSLSVVMPEPEGFLYGFLSQIGLFPLWGFGLFVVGTAALLGKRWQSVVWPLAVVFLLGALLLGAAQAMGSRFGG
jgi:hypothetical protein